MKRKFTRNEHGVKVTMCCASCKKRVITCEESRVCGLSGEQVSGSDRCEHWEMSRRLHNAGMSGGKVKSWRYLCYYRERWIQQREAVIAGRIEADEMLSVADIRKEFEQEHGSIFINF